MRALVVGGVSWNHIVHVDRFPEPFPHTIHARRSSEVLGGTGAGKAWNLAALGWQVDLVAAVGDDLPGRLVRDAIDGLGVRFVGVDDPDGTERHTNLMDAAGDRLSIYTLTGSPDAAIDPDLVVELAQDADLVCVNILGHCRSVLAPLRAAGVDIWTDLHDYDGRDPHHADFVAAASALQLSSDRLPGWRSFAEERVAAGVEVVVCTHGAAGADALDAGGWIHVDPVPAAVVDTNGAGDAFFAGFVTARQAGDGLAVALRSGAEAAAACVSSPGLGPAIS
jgi:sugar/nucleoside kinase (ribokinase family)